MMKRVETRREVLSRPPAEEWQPFAEAIRNLDRGKADQEFTLEVKGESPYYAPNETLIAKVINDPEFKLGNLILTIRPDFYGNAAKYENIGGTHYITMDPYMLYEEANWIFLHELQHAYQMQEERFDLNQYSYIDSSDYRKIPNETDADAMAEKLFQYVNNPGFMLEKQATDETKQKTPALTVGDYRGWGQQAVERLGL